MMRVPIRLTGSTAAALVAGLALPQSSAHAYPRPGSTERVSVASDGTEGEGGLFGFLNAVDASISADARYVAFQSGFPNLVPNETNGVADIFVHDRITRTTERVSVSSGGAEANNHSFAPAISADGRFVAFQSWASNLVAGDTNAAMDVFVYDRITGTTERVSVASGGGQGNDASFSAAIGADGRFVAFVSAAGNLVPDDTNASRDVFVHDCTLGTTERVSLASDASQGNGDSGITEIAPAITGDGRFVAFRSEATNLVTGDINGMADVFVHDLWTGTTERVSVASDGAEGNGLSEVPALSADGRFVAFDSQASNLIPVDSNNTYDVFVHDRSTGITERVSVASDGAEANDGSSIAAVSTDGRYVAFNSSASNLVSGVSPIVVDLFLHDRETSATELVSRCKVGEANCSEFSPGAPGNADSKFPALSPDARFVAFQSLAFNLISNDTNNAMDIFVRDRGQATGVGGLVGSCDGDAASVSGWATFSGAVIAEADDPADDATPGAPAAAELTGASLSYRPERDDLMVRLQVSSLPPVLGGSPGIHHALRFTVGTEGASYEVRAVRAGPGGPGETQNPYFALLRERIPGTWIQMAELTGSMGTTGAEVLVAVPLDSLAEPPAVPGLFEGDALTGVRAYTAFSSMVTSDPGVLIDEIVLPATVLPIRSVSLGIAPAGTPESQVAFDTPASLSDGSFSGVLSAVAAGNYEVWARACLGSACGAASTPVTCAGTVGAPASNRALLLTLRGASPNPFRSATRLSYALPAAGRVSIDVVDTQGRKVESLVEGWQEAGEHEISWNARARPPGLYLVIISSGGVTRTQRLIHVR